MNSSPLNYLVAAGKRAATILPLTWFVLGISVIVCVVIAVVLWLGVRRAAARGGDAETRAVPLAGGAERTRWIGTGLIISAIPLLATLVWTMVALADIAGPPRHPALTVDVFAHQWWWEVRYAADVPDERFTTANEIHIPVGAPVLVRLHAGDVIHSFWVPQLSGKTDVIPGQTNLSWLEASAPGRYRGQCSEYCGWQHAHMAFEVVAQPENDYRAWRQAQLLDAPLPRTSEQTRGQALVEYRCGACHAIRGTTADSGAGPDLTHLMSRHMIAGGLLPNTAPNRDAWIEHAQQHKPGSQMPNQMLTGQELSDVESYLVTLQ